MTAFRDSILYTLAAVILWQVVVFGGAWLIDRIWQLARRR